MSQVFTDMMNFKNNKEACILVTVVEKKGDGPVEVGKKMVVGELGKRFGTVGGGALEYLAIENCKMLLKKQESLLEKYLLNDGKVIKDGKTLPMVCGGVVTMFYEYIGVKENVYIFGAGHVGQALTNVLNVLDFNIIVIDDRLDVYEAFSGATEKVNKYFTDYIDDGIKEDSYVVVTTPGHKHDFLVLDKILESKIKVKYMGLICSEKKLNTYLEQVEEKFGKDVDLNNFYSPIGLDLGGSGSPEEIAISIASEILAVRNKKLGHRHMRNNVKNEKYRYFK